MKTMTGDYESPVQSEAEASPTPKPKSKSKSKSNASGSGAAASSGHAPTVVVSPSVQRAIDFDRASPAASSGYAPTVIAPPSRQPVNRPQNFDIATPGPNTPQRSSASKVKTPKPISELRSAKTTPIKRTCQPHSLRSPASEGGYYDKRAGCYWVART